MYPDRRDNGRLQRVVRFQSKDFTSGQDSARTIEGNGPRRPQFFTTDGRFQIDPPIERHLFARVLHYLRARRDSTTASGRLGVDDISARHLKQRVDKSSRRKMRTGREDTTTRFRRESRRSTSAVFLSARFPPIIYDSQFGSNTDRPSAEFTLVRHAREIIPNLMERYGHAGNSLRQPKRRRDAVLGLREKAFRSSDDLSVRFERS